MSKARKLTLDKAFVITRLLDERYYNALGDAVKMGEAKGASEFEKLCVKADIPKNMISPTWKGLMAYEKESELVGSADW